MNTRINSSRRRGSRGFTLIELLVAITIIVALVVVTLPSFSSLIQSANFSSAISQTTASLGSARAIAMRDGVQTAVAFLFDTKDEQYSLVILIESSTGSGGALSSLPTGPPKHTYAVAFQPAPNTAPVILPQGIGVFGLSYSHLPDPLIDPNVFDEPMIDANTFHWYAGERHPAYQDNGFGAFGLVPDGIFENPWIFPRNDPRLFWQTGIVMVDDDEDPLIVDEPWYQFIEEDPMDPAVIDALRHANSFMIQFNPDGSVVGAFSQGSFSNPANAFIDYPLDPIDQLPIDPLDVDPYDNPTIFDPENAGLDLANAPIKPSRNPEVILRSVSQLAIVDLKQLERGTGVENIWKLHPSTSLAPWPLLYDPDGRPGSGDELPFDDVLLDKRVSMVSRWIDLNGEVIGFDRYTGNIIRRSAP